MSVGAAAAQLSIIWDSSCSSSSSAMSVSTSPWWSSANTLISSSKSSMAELVETERGALRLVLRVLEEGGVFRTGLRYECLR